MAIRDEDDIDDLNGDGNRDNSRGGDRDYIRIPRDLLDADDPHEVLERHRVRRTPFAILIGVGIGLSVAAGIGWYILGKIPANVDKLSEIPVIKASSEPFKVKPDDPGGMDVPNRDKLVYQHLDESAPLAEEERLLPPAETPATPPRSVTQAPELVIPLPQPIATAEKLLPKAPDVKAPDTIPLAGAALPPLAKAPLAVIVPKEIISAPPAVIPPKEIKAEPPVKEVKITHPAKDIKSPPPAKETPPPARETKSAPGVSNGIRVQLVALRTAEDAEIAWGRLEAKHKDILKALPHWVVKADLGEKGTWYRVQAGSFASSEDAASTCAILKQRNVGCLLVKK